MRVSLFALIWVCVLSSDAVFVPLSADHEQVRSVPFAPEAVDAASEEFGWSDLMARLTSAVSAPAFVNPAPTLIIDIEDAPGVAPRKDAELSARVQRLEAQMGILLRATREFEQCALVSLFLVSTLVGCVLCTRRRAPPRLVAAGVAPLEAKIVKDSSQA